MNKMKRPVTTLFMLMSVDGKISSGDNDSLDFDQDLPGIVGANKGLHQYYDIEKTTDFFSLNTGRVMAKIGVNERTDKPTKMPVTFVIIDNKPHLTESGIRYLTDWTKRLILVTTNKSHPAQALEISNLSVLNYSKEVDFAGLFETLHSDFGADYLTVQSGGDMNSLLVRAGLIDYLSIVVAPVIVGGKNTATLVDGESLHNASELTKIKALELVKSETLKDSYLHLVYKVLTS